MRTLVAQAAWGLIVLLCSALAASVIVEFVAETVARFRGAKGKIERASAFLTIAVTVYIVLVIWER